MNGWRACGTQNKKSSAQRDTPKPGMSERVAKESGHEAGESEDAPNAVHQDLTPDNTGPNAPMSHAGHQKAPVPKGDLRKEDDEEQQLQY